VFFHAAVAYYPGCESSLRRARWRPAAPLLILIGAQDDWVPAAPCEQLAARAASQRWPLETIVYPGAHHGFDAASGEVRLLKRVRTGVNPGKGVHVGPHPAAREDANRRIDAFLRSAPRRPSD
jgi:dienelactone hydrolase